jgi:IclR family acetate operon transcriptional repressor
MAETIVLSIKKALNIIDILVFEDFENNGIALSKLAVKTGQRTNTLHNILKTMVACGYVVQKEDGKYAAGKKCKDIGDINKISPQSHLNKYITKSILELSQKLGESVIFTILINGNRVPIISYEHEQLIKVDYTFLENENIYMKDTGRVLTSFADEANLKMIIDNWGMPNNNWEGITDMPTLNKNIADIRSKGYSLSIVADETLVSIAIPVCGDLLGAIGCYAPIFRCDKEKQMFMITQMKATAKFIEEFGS